MSWQPSGDGPELSWLVGTKIFSKPTQDFRHLKSLTAFVELKIFGTTEKVFGIQFQLILNVSRGVGLIEQPWATNRRTDNCEVDPWFSHLS